MANSRIPQPDEIIVLVFGASRWPDCPKFHDAPSLERSADALIRFVRNAEGMGVPMRNIKSFFNSFDEPSEQLDQAQNFVNRRRHEYKEVGKKITDLLIYYAGHGDFERDGREFYMAIKRTHTQWPLLTSITANALGDWVRRTGQDLRTYLIIDCCFAAAAQLGFQTSPIDLAEKRLHEALPNSIESDDGIGFPSAGVALLAAAGMNDTTFAPPEEEYSRFTKHLLEALNGGDKGFPAILSLSDIHLLVHRQVTRLYPDGARPELRSLHQTRGRVELVRLFRNLAVAGKQGAVSPDPPPARSDVNAGNTPPLQDDVPLSSSAAGLADKPPPEETSAPSATNDQQESTNEAADIQQAKRSWFRSNPKIPEGTASKPAGNEQPGTVYGEPDEKPEQSSGKAYDASG